MSLAGFKKQLNKANQYMSEKIGGAKGTELDDEFIEMERKIDVMGRLVEDLIAKTQEYLQPNPASRSKLMVVNSFSKFRGQPKNVAYPQPEGTLGEHMTKHGKDLGDDTLFGRCLVDSGDAFRQLADIKYSLEDNVKQNFLEPLTHLSTKDLKEVNHHRKKLSGRRLDYDCKKRKKDKGSNVTEDEVRVAEEKFEESKSLTETAMYNLLDNEVEQIAQLQSFIESQLDFHKHSIQVLEGLLDTIEEKREEAANKPKGEHVPKRVGSYRSSSPSYFDSGDGGSGSYNFNSTPPVQNSSSKKQPCCEAMFDFEPENEGELAFKEGEIINLISRIDENWFEGSIRGQNGFFPVNYVKVIVDV